MNKFCFNKKANGKMRTISLMLMVLTFISLSLFSVASSMPMIAVTMTDELIDDANMNNMADPGDTLEYTVSITNTGSSNATNVVFADTIDSNTTLSGTAKVSPLAFKDSYTSIGNVGLTVPAANGLLLNDADPDGNVSNSVAAVNGGAGNVGVATATTQGGSVTVLSNGSFVYTPAPGFEGDDTFTYTLSDGDPKTRNDSDTVTITVSDVIWFIDSSQASQGNGTLASPFNSFNGAAGFQTAAADEAGDIIYVYDGNYTGVNLVLLLDQKLLGDGMSGTVAVAAGVTLPLHSRPLPTPTSANPVLTNGSGIGIQLATNNTIQGVTVGNTAGTGIQDNGNVGTLTISETSIVGTGGGFEVDSGGTLAVSLDALSATATAPNEEGIHINATGSFNVLNGTGTISTNGAPAIEINGNNGLNINTLTFASVSGNNAVYGIRLTDINAGSFTVNGTGTTDGSGGSIQNITTRGVEINNTDNVTLKNINLTDANTADGVSATPGSTCDRLDGGTNTGCNGAVYIIDSATIALDNLNIDDTEQNGVNGNNVTGLTLTNSVFTNIGNVTGAQRENALHVINLLGTSSINGNTFTGNSTHTTRNVLIENSTGTLNLTMNDNNIATANTNGVRMRAQGSATMNVSGLRNTFTTNGDTEFEFNAVGNSTIDVDLGDGSAANENVFIGTPGTIGSGAGIVVDGRDSARFTFNILANELRPVRSNGITVVAFGGSSGEGNITGNEVQGNEQGWGILARAESAGSSPSMIVNISNNIVGNVDPIGTVGSGAAGIEVSSQQGSLGAGTANVQGTINNNTVTIGGADSIIQNFADAGNVLCLSVTNNSAAGAATSPFAGGGSTHYIGNPVFGSGLAAGSITYNNHTAGNLAASWNNNGNSPALAGGSGGEAFVDGTDPTLGGACTAPSVSGPSPMVLVSLPEMSGNEVARLQMLVDGESAAQQLAVAQSNQIDAIVAQTELTVAEAEAETEIVVSPTSGRFSLSRPFGLSKFAQSGETVNQSIGTMEPDQVVEIVFQVTVDDPLSPASTTQVCNQGTVTADSGISVMTDDPAVGGAADSTCTTIPASPGGIVIVQNSIPDGDQDFSFVSPGLSPTSFDLDDDSDGTLSNTQTFNSVVAGSYTITQTVPAGYFFPSMSCDDGSSSVPSTITPASSILTANVESGETVTCTFTNQRIPVADLSITNTDGQTTAIPGEVITYTRVISNAGPDNVIGATASGVPPADLSGVTWTCMAGTGASCSNASGSGKILLESVDLMAGSSLTFTLSGLIDSDATGTLSNIASISVPGTTADLIPGNNNATDNDTVLVPTADLSISKISSDDPVLSGDTLTYTVTVTNNGPSNATNVVVTEALPAGVTLASTSGCAEDPAGVSTCTLGTIAASGNVSFTVVTTIDALTVGTITNTVSVSTSATDPIGSNDTFTETTEVVSVPEIAIAGDVQVIEGDSGTVDMVFTLTRTHNTVENTVDVATRDVTAAAGSDYTAVLTQTVTFPAGGALSQTVTVTVSSETDIELDETLELVLRDPTNGTLGDDVAVGTITNDDFATVTLTGGAAQAEGDSGSMTQVFTATLDAAIPGGFTIAYTVEDGTATVADGDYDDNDATLSFAGNANETQTINVTVNGDDKVEADETFIVTLGALSASPLTSTIMTAGSPQVGTITNDDVMNLTLTGGGAQIEGDSGTITYTFIITSDALVDGGYNLDVQTLDGTATAADGDYQFLSQTLNVPGALGVVYRIVAFGDTKGESDEMFTFEIGPVSNTVLTDSINIIGSPQTATILNDDPGVFYLSTGSPTIIESTTMVPVTVTLSAPETFTTTVDYGTMAGTATAGNDYTETSGSLTFAPGETVKTFDISILDDTISESDETLIIALTNPVSTTLGNPFTATITIVDDEAAPETSFSSSAVSGDESGGTIPVTVTLDHGSANTVTVMVQSADGTPISIASATAGSDYTGISQTVTFEPGETSQIVNVVILPDGDDEPNEEFSLMLSDPSNSSLGSPSTVVITIIDDDDPLPSGETAIFLPMTKRSKAPGPDLIVESIEMVNGSVQLTIKNVGNVPVNSAFWVDLFINPTVLPTMVNDTIGILNQDGLVWGIDPALIPLGSGESLILTPGDSSFAAPFSTFSGTISAGDLLVAHVDSANTTTTYGAVNESHEMSGDTYNNITSTPAPASATAPDVKVELGQR